MRSLQDPDDRNVQAPALRLESWLMHIAVIVRRRRLGSRPDECASARPRQWSRKGPAWTDVRGPPGANRSRRRSARPGRRDRAAASRRPRTRGRRRAGACHPGATAPCPCPGTAGMAAERRSLVRRRPPCRRHASSASIRALRVPAPSLRGPAAKSCQKSPGTRWTCSDGLGTMPTCRRRVRMPTETARCSPARNLVNATLRRRSHLETTLCVALVAALVAQPAFGREHKAKGPDVVRKAATVVHQATPASKRALRDASSGTTLRQVAFAASAADAPAAPPADPGAPPAPPAPAGVIAPEDGDSGTQAPPASPAPAENAAPPLAPARDLLERIPAVAPARPAAPAP